jgi:hypothetical protein
MNTSPGSRLSSLHMAARQGHVDTIRVRSPAVIAHEPVHVPISFCSGMVLVRSHQSSAVYSKAASPSTLLSPQRAKKQRRCCLQQCNNRKAGPSQARANKLLPPQLKSQCRVTHLVDLRAWLEAALAYFMQISPSGAPKARKAELVLPGSMSAQVLCEPESCSDQLNCNNVAAACECRGRRRGAASAAEGHGQVSHARVREGCAGPLPVRPARISC